MATQSSVVILAHRGDLAAVGLAIALHRRGRCRVSLADEYGLVGARIVHRPRSGWLHADAGAAGDGSAADLVELPDGTRITPATDVVLCRIAALPAAAQSDPGRQAYANAETNAWALSWLAGLGDAVVNQPSPLSLTGVEPDLLSLQRLASAVGLATPNLRLAANAASSPIHPGFQPFDWPVAGMPGWYATTPRRDAGPPLPRPLATGEPVRPMGRALVLGGDVLHAPPALHDRLAALADAIGLTVCEVGLGQALSAAEPVVTGVLPVPRLTGPGQLAALAGYLERRGHDRMLQGSAA